MNPELILYIKTQQSAGMPKDAIKELLIGRGGWHPEDVEAAFASLEPAKAPAPIAQTPIQPQPTATPSSWLAPKPATPKVASAPAVGMSEISAPVHGPVTSPLTRTPMPAEPAPRPVQDVQVPSQDAAPSTFVPAPKAPLQSPQPVAPATTSIPATPIIKDYTLVQGTMGSPEPVRPAAPSPAPMRPLETPVQASKPIAATPINDIRPTGTIVGAQATPITATPAPIAAAAPVSAFVGMGRDDQDVVITETPTRSRAGKIALAVVAILILLALGGGAAYAYVFYVNPSPERAFTLVIPKLENAKTGHYKATITATYNKDLASALVTTPPGLTPVNQGVTIASNPDATATLVVDGTFDKATVGSEKIQSTVSLSTSAIPLNLSFETRLIGANLYIKVPDLGFLNDSIGPIGVATGDWVEVSKAELSQASANDPMLASSLTATPLTILATTSSQSLATSLLGPGIITPTIELAKGSYAGTKVHRYQFTVNQNALRSALAKAYPSISNDTLTQLLGTFTVVDGEIWTGMWDGKPYKILFTVKPTGELAQQVQSIVFDVTLDSFGSAVIIDTPSDAKPLISLITEAGLKAKDQRTMQTISMVKAQAEIYYAQKRTYLGLCAADTGLKNMIATLDTILAPNTAYCKDAARTFAVAAPLVTQSGTACVDVAGTPGILPVTPTTTSCK